MKIPQVRGRNKIRDAKIVRLWAEGEATQEELALRFNLSPTRVWQICYRNADLVKINEANEKILRVNHLKRLLKKHPERLSNARDAVDLIKELRAETTTPEGSQSGGMTKVIIIRETPSGEKQPDADPNQERSVPRPISVFRV
jgi:transposase-like protein